MKLILKFKRKKKFNEIVLLFSAMGINFSVLKQGDYKIIVVPDEEREKALREIALYRKENVLYYFRGEEKSFVERRELIYYSIIIVFFSLYLFQMIDVNFLPEYDLKGLGALVIERTKNSEFYRLVTSLTLHADFVHLLSNAFFGGIICYFLFQYTGIGFGWFMVMLSGIMGNFVNIFFHENNFVSFGSSSAFFGALGIITSTGIYERKGVQVSKGYFLPLASAVAIFSMFGVSPESDIGGHLFGFVSGLILGVLFSLIKGKLSKRKMLFSALSIFFGIFSLFTVVISWYLAFKNFKP